MTRYCGELYEVGIPADVAVTYRAAGPAGSLARLHQLLWGRKAELSLLIIGPASLKRVRLCLPELLGFLREGETVCIYLYKHLLLRQVMIGVRSGDGPSWTLNRAQLLMLVATYLVVWPLLVGIPAALAGWLAGYPLGTDGVRLGISLGLLGGAILSWFSAMRLVRAWREMQRG